MQESGLLDLVSDAVQRREGLYPTFFDDFPPFSIMFKAFGPSEELF